MVQEFVVLRCYSCQTFQVHQIKKVPKWNCKVCGEKQSRKKVYGQGKAIDCRKHVQKLNMMRGHIEDSRHTVEEDGDGDDDVNYSLSSSGAGGIEDFVIGQQDLVSSDECFGSVKSKWSKFMMTNSSDSERFEDDESGRFQVTTERAQFEKAACKRKRRETTKDPAKKGGNSGGKTVKRQFLECRQQQEDFDTDHNKSKNLIEKVCEQGRDEDSHSDSGVSQQTSLKLTRPGVNAARSNISTRDQSLCSDSKWSKFLASSNDESTQPYNNVLIASDNASSPECSHSFNVSSHSSSGQTSGTNSCSNTEEIITCGTQTKSAKFTSVFSIDDLEEDWLQWEQ